MRMRPHIIIALLLTCASLPGAVEFDKLPLAFEANRGQAGADVMFLTAGPGRRVLFTCDGPVLGLRNSGGHRAVPLRMTLHGGNRTPSIEGEDRLPGTSNYLVGSDPARWRTSIPQYAKVRYRSVYAGMDVVFYGNEQEMEFDFLLAPHTDAGRIEMDFDGAESLRVDTNGDLLLTSAAGGLRLHKPIAYQEVDGRRTEVACRYVLKGKRGVAFQTAAYDATRPLVIDPVLVYSTYLDVLQPSTDIAIAVDGDGNAYVAGSTDSDTFPTTAAAYQPQFIGATCSQSATTFPCSDAFVLKLNSTGTALLYSTYIGGSFWDGISGIAVDEAGNAYVTGSSGSSDFPTTPGAYQTQGYVGPFVTKLNSTGTVLVYSTHSVGGTSIALDSSGSAYVAGDSHVPTLCKLKPDGSALDYQLDLSWTASSVAVDAAGNAYLAGIRNAVVPLTLSGVPQASFGTGGGSDALVIKVSASGLPLYAAYLGGSGTETVTAVGADAAGFAWVAGQTLSTNFPVTAAAVQSSFQSSTGSAPDMFLAKIDLQGQTLPFATYLGGAGADSVNGLAVDGAGSVYISGTTQSYDFPTTRGAFQPCLRLSPQGLSQDVVLAKFSSQGQLLYSTFLGGSEAEDVSQVALDSAGNVYLAGSTHSSNFPVSTDAYRAARPATNYTFLHGSNPAIAFVTKVTPVAGPPLVSTCVVNAASLQHGPVSPGETVAIFGSHIGPVNGAYITVGSDLRWPPQAAGIRVLFDGVPAPLLWVQREQINAIVPYAVAGRLTTYVQIEDQGDLTTQAPLTVSESNPAGFTLAQSGRGLAVIVNEDGTINNAGNEAQLGSIVSIFATGEGMTDPAGTDGLLASLSPPWPKPLLPLEVYIDSKLCELLYAGAAPTLTAGVMRIDVRVPSDTAFPSRKDHAAPLVIKMGNATSQPLVTLWLAH